MSVVGTEVGTMWGQDPNMWGQASGAVLTGCPAVGLAALDQPESSATRREDQGHDTRATAWAGILMPCGLSRATVAAR